LHALIARFSLSCEVPHAPMQGDSDLRSQGIPVPLISQFF
jgi:hypothetical protein